MNDLRLYTEGNILKDIRINKLYLVTFFKQNKSNTITIHLVEIKENNYYNFAFPRHYSYIKLTVNPDKVTDTYKHYYFYLKIG